MPEIKDDIEPLDLQFKIRRLGLRQRDLKRIFKVTDGAISSAINNDPKLKKLRERIINYLNLSQSNTKTKEVA